MTVSSYSIGTATMSGGVFSFGFPSDLEKDEEKSCKLDEIF